MIKFATLVMLLAAGTAAATPMPSREKPNALGFHQHQPKSSLHNYTLPSQLGDTYSTGDETSNSAPATGPGRVSPNGKPSASPPVVGPGRIAPVDKPTIATSTPGPGRMTPQPVDKTKKSPPEVCLSQRIG